MCVRVCMDDGDGMGDSFCRFSTDRMRRPVAASPSPGCGAGLDVELNALRPVLVIAVMDGGVTVAGSCECCWWWCCCCCCSVGDGVAECVCGTGDDEIMLLIL